MITMLYDFLFHRHKWSVIKIQKLVDETGKERGVGIFYQCEKCGNIKYKRIKF